MIEFKKNYTEKFINITPDNNFNYQLANQYGPWVATVSNKSDMDLFIASPKMAEYMMDRANCIEKEIRLGVCYDPDGSKEELQTILSILKDAGVEVVGK